MARKTKAVEVEVDRMARCGDCGKSWPESVLIRPIPRIEERVDAGEVMPAGECPRCHALCHLITGDNTERTSPAPWEADWLDDEHGWVMSADGLYLAEAITQDDEGKVERSALVQRNNLNLMAAAPDLRDAGHLLAQAIKELLAAGGNQSDRLLRDAREALKAWWVALSRA